MVIWASRLYSRSSPPTSPHFSTHPLLHCCSSHVHLSYSLFNTNVEKCENTPYVSVVFQIPHGQASTNLHRSLAYKRSAAARSVEPGPGKKRLERLELASPLVLGGVTINRGEASSKLYASEKSIWQSDGNRCSWRFLMMWNCHLNQLEGAITVVCFMVIITDQWKNKSHVGVWPNVANAKAASWEKNMFSMS